MHRLIINADCQRRLLLAGLAALLLEGCASHNYVPVKNGCMVDAVVEKAIYRQKANLQPWYWSKILVVHWSNPNRMPNTHALCTFVFNNHLCAYDYYGGTREIPLRYLNNALAIANYLYDTHSVGQAWFAEDMPPMRMTAGLSGSSRVSSTGATPQPQAAPATRTAPPSKPSPASVASIETKRTPPKMSDEAAKSEHPVSKKVATKQKAPQKVAIASAPPPPSANTRPALRASVSDYGSPKIRVSDGTLYLQN